MLDSKYYLSLELTICTFIQFLFVDSLDISTIYALDSNVILVRNHNLENINELQCNYSSKIYVNEPSRHDRRSNGLVIRVTTP